MSRPVIISCAVTGSGDTTGVSAHVPVTPKQIADDALAAHAAGAAVVHIHVRHPQTGAPSRDIDLYRDVVDRIRSSRSDVILNLTTGIGGRFSPDEADPNRNASPGMASPEDRMNHVLELRPEICSLGRCDDELWQARLHQHARPHHADRRSRSRRRRETGTGSVRSWSYRAGQVPVCQGSICGPPVFPALPWRAMGRAGARPMQ